ncbi:MAG: hypothetical protein PHI94_00515 [Eubacteriaceae bacterium]|jgi:hypothetical protein|nr:hypothetical protein [Eubacteriaceae bacterium]MDD4507661.1 hypothetical protein [Eubacteriaceae bacterium]
MSIQLKEKKTAVKFSGTQPEQDGIREKGLPGLMKTARPHQD